VARWQRNEEVVPAHLAAFDPLEWGPGDAGVRAWRRDAVEWPNSHPGKRIPFGQFGISSTCFREGLRLMGACGPR
jgi:hypothetical protein